MLCMFCPHLCLPLTPCMHVDGCGAAQFGTLILASSALASYVILAGMTQMGWGAHRSVSHTCPCMGGTFADLPLHVYRMDWRQERAEGGFASSMGYTTECAWRIRFAAQVLSWHMQELLANKGLGVKEGPTNRAVAKPEDRR